MQPDEKDWTWVLERACPECGFDPVAYPRDEFVKHVRRDSLRWQRALGENTVRARPREEKWSTLEYGCHVRDVLSIFHGRLRSMLEEDEPVFPNWDQDRTALEEHYDRQEPGVITTQLGARSAVLESLLEGVEGAQWQRPGRRSNGSAFTVESLARYMLHDLRHHLWDIGQSDAADW